MRLNFFPFVHFSFLKGTLINLWILCMSSISTERALGIHEILSEIIVKTHQCSSFDCLEPIAFEMINKPRNCINDHIEALSSCILVSRSWAKAAIPQLWGRYASLGCLVSLLADFPQNQEWSVYYERRPDIQETVGVIYRGVSALMCATGSPSDKFLREVELLHALRPEIVHKEICITGWSDSRCANRI